MSNKKQLSTFFVNGYYFGVDVLCVQEVLNYQNMTRVPLAPDMLQGLINLRGQIVTAIDMRRRMGFPIRDEQTHPMNVVVRTSDAPVSLLVDEIGDVLEVDDREFEAPPATLGKLARDLVKGVYKLQGKLLLVLNTEMAVTIPG